MNNKEIYLDGVLLELDEKKNPIQLTYAINDLAELRDRQAYSTNVFKIPATPSNRAACGIPDDANLIQLKPYRKNGAKIVQGGIEVLVNGIAIITECDTSISVQVLSGLVGFFDILADKKIRDLDLSEYDHTWNLLTVADSQNNTEGFIYPVIDYGGLSLTAREADVRQLRPAVFRKTIIEKIISEAGYTASGSYEIYDKYIRSLLPFSNDKFEHSKDFAENLGTYKTSARNPNDLALDPSQLEQLITLSDDATTDPYNNWNGQVYTAPRHMRVTVSYKYTITQVRLTLFGSTPENYVFLQKNGANVASNLTTTTEPVYTPQVFPNQEISATLDLAPGDQVRLNVLQQPGPNRVYTMISQGSQLVISPIVEDVIYGSEIQLSATLPDVTQKNFFKDFLQNFGLIVIPDNYKQDLLLINMEDVYNNKPIAQDITDKIIDTKDNITYSFGSYGVNNYGKYKEDDAVPTDTGQGVLVFDNLTLEPNVTIFQSVFAASVTVNKMGGVNVTEIKKIEDIALSSEFKTKTQPRILLNNTLSTSFRFFDGGGEQIRSLISLPVFEGLGYDVLFAENYPEFLRMLYRPFITIKDILLSEIDIANIDWRIPVYDKKSASYYYKNAIKYLQGDRSTITLIRLP